MQQGSGRKTVVTEHLPECILPTYLDAVLWRRAPQGLRVPCICDELRACEERVLDAALKALYLMENMGGYPEFDFDHIRDDFRDVIDSLKEKP